MALYNSHRGILCTMLVLIFFAFSFAGFSAPVALTGEIAFTIPWGEGWGRLTFIPEAELGEGMYYGPSAMVVAPDGSLYVYDPAMRRIQSFDPGGKFITGAELGPGIGSVVSLTFGPDKSGSLPALIVADDSGYIAKLDKFGPDPGRASCTQLLKGIICDGWILSGVGAATPGATFVQGRGTFEVPYILCYDADRYRRRFNATDLVPLTPRYYALALDRNGTGVYTSADGQFVIQEIDGYEMQVSREIPINPPAPIVKGRRWTLIGASARGLETVFFLATHSNPAPDEQIYLVSETGNVLGMAKAAIPGGKNPGQYLRHWMRLTSVNYHGDLYVAIPDDKGLVVVRYKPPALGG